MSITITTDLSCDVCQIEWIHGIAAGKPMAKYTRKKAKQYGWKRERIGGVLMDVCPDCLDRQARQQKLMNKFLEENLPSEE